MDILIWLERQKIKWILQFVFDYMITFAQSPKEEYKICSETCEYPKPAHLRTHSSWSHSWSSPRGPVQLSGEAITHAHGQTFSLEMLLNEARNRPRHTFTPSNELRNDDITSSRANHRNEALTVSLNPHLSTRCAGTTATRYYSFFMGALRVIYNCHKLGAA